MLPLDKVLTPSCLEAFNWDSSLVREMREEYFKRHCLNFSTENTHDLSEVFWQMIMATELLSSFIYEFKEVWIGPDELQQANYALRSLPKGLKFLRAVSPSESPKVMGLTGIHDLDALCHFYRVTHCPWSGKEGQNEGTVVNHLWTVHYRLGLVCKKCYGCPSTLSEAIQCHGQKDCQPSGEGGANESSSSVWLPAGGGWGQALPNRNLDRGSKEDSSIPWATLLGIAPAPSAQPWRRTKWRRHHLPTWHIPSPKYSCTQIKWLLPFTSLELHRMSTKDAGLYELKVKG